MRQVARAATTSDVETAPEPFVLPRDVAEEPSPAPLFPRASTSDRIRDALLRWLDEEL